MKVMTILGTRPEIIRLSRIIPKLDKLCDHIVIHTGQNYDPNLNDIFFEDLNLRQPDYFLGVQGKSFGDQVGKILTGCEEIMLSEKPDRVLILGDTNSSLCTIVAKRLGVPVFHMEAGNRCYDDRVPEEVNRRIIDHSSDILLPYTERSRANLIQEGIVSKRIFATGNPIYEVIGYYQDTIERSDIIQRLGLKKREYFLVTLHRAENVDIEERLRALMHGLQSIYQEYQMPIVCSLHPRTKDKMHRFGIENDHPGIQFHAPFGFFDFIFLEQNARCVLSDSGTVQEECCIFNVPNVTLRDVTERPETLECGSNILSGAESEDIMRCVACIFENMSQWAVPPEYLFENVSDTVVKIVLGYHVIQNYH
ncbi:UDP-N-acetylglucosamine 2-epimerase (non-hydrolyzing) [Methanogenium sp. S4BF]|uniref:non-hydrolyzing UDP-N-acetylglucosamine 2-epimerase n=1 Tax=Methanogenium sp. S4BF TaxID=1789226 RepID=UPI00241629EE|nr:UDP-N-acetylglucosamine 2-epimerase (non-hydrolyzing) [Methanogenium sp. S4BF]WFN34987.1 UDP-N-acetylglucosamine 2-epimerase (non-hydrolyzing) [Methanogenium sp. S4BF]